MTYTLEGHTLKHAVEEMLLHLLPTAALTRADAPGEGDCCRSGLTERDGIATARAVVQLDGVQRTGARSAPVAGLAPVARKRVVTELVRMSIYDAVAPTLARPPVWGSLTGVRPAKLARGLLERGMSRGEAAQHLREHFFVSPARTALTMRAAATAMALDRQIGPDDISLYVGIPFCPSRCYYCSFVSSTTAQSAQLIEPYLDALCREIRETAALVREAGKRVQSVYIGGGTPTTLDARQLARLLDALQAGFSFSGLLEYTVEAGRPDTITPEKLRVLRAAGVDRVSINPQSMDDAVLAAIGRGHTAADVLRSYEQARAVGFAAINMDVIAGLNGDTADTFARTVDTLTGLTPENITVHTLSIKRGADLTDKGAAAARYETVRAMLEYAAPALQNAGYGPYYLYRQKFMAGGFENVGWCVPGAECFYNVAMMEELQTILSLGAGGVSKRVVRESGWIERANNPKYPREYIAAADRLAVGKRRILCPTQEGGTL
ncbi:MAG: coproporphyrinogen dehydrogenase HemZ [Agathobaculum sp.]|uniref:coproporphyrinogen dehydrogenase HemZ n=1 Tax=Agathobaculum sp. TaxID=2048138 RepID=UPI0025BBBF44|nr:coproporphyrinogen dehydrogenase HemZ [Agathobaculum sp.]MCI7126550.1 coproporphyrinogen dehydrogenase HemZ [Agathobaculum sp.]